ncbi:MAG: metal transporter substrate-binding protein [Rubritepida sp.]|nr:metal transporter substrate-binding protein [Rubritepida sp.]
MHRRALLALAAVPVAAQAQTGPTAVASFSILGDMLRQVAGERMPVQVIVGPDMDAHHFQPRPSHAEAVRQAQLVVRNGAGFDSWFDRLLGSTRFRGATATATDGIALRSTASGQDPHAWQDLRLGLQYVRNIEAGLIQADPAGSEHYRTLAAAYAARLEALDAWVRVQIAAVPAARRVVVTSHDAFAYFGAAYGVSFRAPQGMAMNAEPSAQQVAALIRQIRGEGVTAVFIENIANPATLRRLADEAGVRIRGRLYTDALSAAVGPAASYEAMVRHNVSLLVPAMLGAG